MSAKKIILLFFNGLANRRTSMKKILYSILMALTFVFTSCFSMPWIPGYVNEDGSIVPPYTKTAVVNVTKGTLSLTVKDTYKGEKSIKAKPENNSENLPQKQFLSTGATYSYPIYGNHTIVIEFSSIDEAEFTITYNDESMAYTVTSKDVLGKTIYLSNFN